MNVPGTNLETEDPIQPQEREPGSEPVQQDDADDPTIVETVKVGEQKMVPLSVLMEARKGEKALKKQLEEERAARQATDAKVTEIMPYVEAIKANPALIDAAQGKTRPSAADTIQPEDDQEAQAWAQDNGLITAGGELDVARARRQLNYLEKLAEKKAQQAIGPLRQSEAQRSTLQNRERARQVTLQDGSRAASDESINEAFQLLADAPQLTADPQVAMLMPIIAAGLDVFKGRRPSAKRDDYDEPLYTEPAGGSRRAAPVNSELLRIAQKVGLSEKDLATSAGPNRRGVALE